MDKELKSTAKCIFHIEAAARIAENVGCMNIAQTRDGLRANRKQPPRVYFKDDARLDCCIYFNPARKAGLIFDTTSKILFTNYAIQCIKKLTE